MNNSKAEVTVISQPGLKAQETERFSMGKYKLPSSTQFNHRQKANSRDIKRVISEFDTIFYFKKLLKQQD